MNKKQIIIGGIVVLLIVAVIAAAAIFGGKREEEWTPPDDMPENIIDYNNKTGDDFVPVDGVEEHGNVAEVNEEDMRLPSEDELGEYQEIFMNGDLIDEDTIAGWVVEISLKDITVNTYNTLTTYAIEESAMSTAVHLKPGDAVTVKYHEDEKGNRSAYDLGRVRVEDEPLTKEEIEQMYNGAEIDE